MKINQINLSENLKKLFLLRAKTYFYAYFVSKMFVFIDFNYDPNFGTTQFGPKNQPNRLKLSQPGHTESVIFFVFTCKADFLTKVQNLRKGDKYKRQNYPMLKNGKFHLCLELERA